jgi:hypothetical protein
VDVNDKPLVGATVAIKDNHGKVLAWSKTNAEGQYAIAADPMTALQLRPSRRRGLLEQCARAVGDVAMAPVKMVGSAVANPGKTLTSVAASVATGTPAPLAAQMAVPVLGDKNVASETGKQARDAAVKTAAGGKAVAGQKPPAVVKGEAQMLVSAPGCKDATGPAEAYWLACPCTDKDRPLGMQAWMETVKLAPVAGDKKSEIEHEALTLTDQTIEPTLVPAGGTVKITVKLQSPPGPDCKVRIFARELRKDTVVELTQQGSNKNSYSGSLILDPKTPAGETIVTIAALRAEPVEVKIDQKKADPLIEFVRRLDDMEANKPYEYDPRIMASKNRLDVKLNVLDVKKQTPTSPPPPASSGH